MSANTQPQAIKLPASMYSNSRMLVATRDHRRPFYYISITGTVIAKVDVRKQTVDLKDAKNLPLALIDDLYTLIKDLIALIK